MISVLNSLGVPRKDPGYKTVALGSAGKSSES